MSEPLFTVVLQNTEEETFLQDIAPAPTETEDDYFSSERTYILLKNGETKYRLYFYMFYFQLTSEDNNHLIQSGDLEHKYVGSFFERQNDDLKRLYQFHFQGLQENELVIDGHDLYNRFTVAGLEDALYVYNEWQGVMEWQVMDDVEDVTMQDAEQDAEQVLLSQDPDGPNAPIALRF